jgi:surfeit locus 1 family protein
LIRLRIGSGIFAPRLGPTLVTVVCLTILLGLGTWQVQRLHWKETLQEAIDRRAHDAPVDIAAVVAAADADYRAVKASGVFLYDHEFFLFATALKSGEGGYHVLTPLQLADARFFLVDRGWIPYAKKQAEGGFSRPSGIVEVRGILRMPAPRGWFQPHNDPAKGDWYSVDLAKMAETAKLGPLLPYVLDADASANEGGYPVGGQTILALRNDHFGYALTWYGLAIVLLVIYGLSSFRKTPEG